MKNLIEVFLIALICTVVHRLDLFASKFKDLNGFIFTGDIESKMSLSNGLSISALSHEALDYVPGLSAKAKGYMVKNNENLKNIEAINGTQSALLTVPGIGEKNIKKFQNFFIYNHVPINGVENLKSHKKKNFKQKKRSQRKVSR